MGSAALAFLAQRGVKVIGIEAAYPAHALSSSHGDSRLIRLGYFEDPSYVPLLLRAYENWHLLEAQLRTEILTISGVLQIGAPTSAIVTGSRASCQMHGLAYEELDSRMLARRYPQFSVDAEDVAIFDPEGGFLRPELAIMGYLKLAAQHGAIMHFGEKVTAIAADDAGVSLAFGENRCRARNVIVATGPWIGELVPELAAHANPIRQVVAWYRPGAAIKAGPQDMPAFLYDQEDGSYFGFPAFVKDGIKLGRHAHFYEPLDPNAANPPVNRRDTDLLDDFISRHIPSAAGQRVNAITCRYTMLPDENFLLDHLPSEKRIIVASPCSGHGFKFASVIGEILADLAVKGETSLPIDAFSFDALQKRVQGAENLV
ncbi:N-methyl-L-tryptophan oxidase [Allorhizobium sp. BGMRC 0089]|nr:N-methyl-L-tryptophan oxidase [Allorhizobium sonneratiae]